jgi:hypothetical protein
MTTRQIRRTLFLVPVLAATVGLTGCGESSSRDSQPIRSFQNEEEKQLLVPDAQSRVGDFPRGRNIRQTRRTPKDRALNPAFAARRGPVPLSTIAFRPKRA